MSPMKQGRCAFLLVAGFALQGCASRDRWLDCEANLEPINPPAPVHAAEAKQLDGEPNAPASRHHP